MTKELYLITNRKLVKGGNFFSVIEEAVAGGLTAVILREKDLSTAELLPLAEEIKKIIAGQKTKLIVNSNLEVAKNVGADGIQISFSELLKQRPLWNGLIGASIHSLHEAVLAEKKGANYLLVGHIFPTDCKKGLQPKGVELISSIKEAVKIPVIALGGLNPDNVGEVLKAGADGIAVMSAVMSAEEPFKMVQKLNNKINKIEEMV